MSWLTEISDASILRDRAAKALSLPIGLANPLWLAFGAAAGAGAAWWMLTRWIHPVRREAVVEPGVVLALSHNVATTAATATEPSIASPPPLLTDDLTVLVGIGPKTAEALAARGVARFADLAAWSADKMAAFDAEMKLKGRSLRNAWLDQAKALAAAN